MPERVELTAEGKRSMEEELKRLVEIEEPELLHQMQTAASQGDLRENFAYHDARRELGMLRGRIADLRQKLQYATVIEKPRADGRARLGSVVVVQEEGESEQEEFLLVSEAETSQSRKDGKTNLSIAAPFGQALLGKKAGEKASFPAPNGRTLTFMIVKVI